MGSGISRAKTNNESPVEKNKTWLHEKGHKTYLITSPGMDFVKIGYTSQSLYKGVWKAYRRAYGDDQEILKVYKATKFKEDEDIHRVLHVKYGNKDKKREIYHKKYIHEIIVFLDDWHLQPGCGPFIKKDILFYNKNVIKEEIFDNISFVIISKVNSNLKLKQ